jgi:hypothetical protein
MVYVGLSEESAAELEAFETEIGDVSDRLAGVGCQTRQHVTNKVGKLGINLFRESDPKPDSTATQSGGGERGLLWLANTIASSIKQFVAAGISCIQLAGRFKAAGSRC